jgi:hypothetical protein
MILALILPRLGKLTGIQTVQKIHVVPGCEIKAGTKLVDIRLDLGAAAPQDCVPISFFRIVSREKAWLRQLAIASGEIFQESQPLALLSTDPQELLQAEPERALRISTASILGDVEWFTHRDVGK